MFKINEIECGYSPNSPVVKIKSLEINRGELIFLLGESGIGKSTLIETLGIMNNTILDSSLGNAIYIKPDNSEVDLKSIWSKKDSFISDFRASEYSFIFQETNLLPSLSVGENIAITGLLNSSNTLENVRKEIESALIDLGFNNQVYDRDVSQLSGGQKQRVAFLRSVFSDYNVIFGDEPTGNLDVNTSNLLISYLKKKLKLYKKSAIIVTHNIDLALSNADKIVVISKKFHKDKMIGYLTTSNQINNINSTDWRTYENALVDSPTQWILSKLNDEENE